MRAKADLAAQRTRFKAAIVGCSVWVLILITWIMREGHGPVEWAFIGLAVVFAGMLAWSVWSLHKLGPRERDADRE